MIAPTTCLPIGPPGRSNLRFPTMRKPYPSKSATSSKCGEGATDRQEHKQQIKPAKTTSCRLAVWSTRGRLRAPAARSHACCRLADHALPQPRHRSYADESGNPAFAMASIAHDQGSVVDTLATRTRRIDHPGYRDGALLGIDPITRSAPCATNLRQLLQRRSPDHKRNLP